MGRQDTWNPNGVLPRQIDYYMVGSGGLSISVARGGGACQQSVARQLSVVARLAAARRVGSYEPSIHLDAFSG